MDSFRPRSIKKTKSVQRAPLSSSASGPTLSAPSHESNDAGHTTTTSNSIRATTSSVQMLPRAVAKGAKVLPLAAVTKLEEMDDDEPVASTSKALLEVKLDPKEAEKREAILVAIESCFCDWGLSTHKNSGLGEKLKGTKDGFIHLQHLLTLPPIRALTNAQIDLQNALKSRPSDVVVLSDSGFQIRRNTPPDFDRLDSLTPEYWDSMTIYLENLRPLSNGLPSTPHNLSHHLSTLLHCPIEKVILPQLYDPLNPPDRSMTLEDPTGQSQAFASALGAQKKKIGSLSPTGGGAFKGFAFVILGGSEGNAEDVLRKFPWEKETEKDDKKEEMGEKEEEDEEMLDPGEKNAKESGLRTLPLAKWLELKSEYLSYQATLLSLKESNSYNNSHPHQASNDSRRPHSPSRQNRGLNSSQQIRRELPPHQQPDFDHRSQYPVASSSTSTSVPSNSKRRQEPQGEERGRSSAKRARRASSPGRWEKREHTPSTEDDEKEEDDNEGEMDADAEGAFPKGCVLWIRNVHEKSTRDKLKGVFRGILESLEEGSGGGVEFVDYEKGLDQCHVRMTSAHLADILFRYLEDAKRVHVTAGQVFPSPTRNANAPPPSEEDQQRLPLKAQIIDGEREKIYWSQLSEKIRASARKSAGAGGPVSKIIASEKKKAKVEMKLKIMDLVEKEVEELLKDDKERVEATEAEARAGGVQAEDAQVEPPVAKRKKPSRF